MAHATLLLARTVARSPDCLAPTREGLWVQKSEKVRTQQEAGGQQEHDTRETQACRDRLGQSSGHESERCSADGCLCHREIVL